MRTLVRHPALPWFALFLQLTVLIMLWNPVKRAWHNQVKKPVQPRREKISLGPECLMTQKEKKRARKKIRALAMQQLMLKKHLKT